MELAVLPPPGLPLRREAGEVGEKKEKEEEKEASFRAPEQFKLSKLATDSKQWWLCQEIATADKSWLKNLPSPPNFYPLVPVTLRHHAKKEENKLCT